MPGGAHGAGWDSGHLTNMEWLGILLEPVGSQEPQAKTQKCLPYSDVSLFEPD